MTVELLSALEDYLSKSDQANQQLLVARLRANGLRLPAEQAPAGTRVEIDLPTLTRLIQGVMDHGPATAGQALPASSGASVVKLAASSVPRHRPQLGVVAAGPKPAGSAAPLLRRLPHAPALDEAIAASEATAREIKAVYARSDLDEASKSRLVNALRSENLARYPLHPDLEVDIWSDRFAF